MRFIGSKKAAAQFVNDILLSLNGDWQSITIINQGLYEGSSVLTAIDISWEDTEKKLAQNYLNMPTNI